MALVDLQRWRFLVNRDAEFSLTARAWNAVFKLQMGEAACLVRVREGQIAEIDEAPTPFDAYEIEISGPEEGWRKFLEPSPPPFYQDVFPAVMRHGFTMGGDVESLFAYYPAARRMFELLRSARSED